MDIVCAPAGIVSRESSRQGIMDIAIAGFSHILLDISLYCTPAELENNGKKILSEEKGNQSKMLAMLQPLLRECKNYNLITQTAYAPYLMRSTKHSDLNGLMKQLAEESIKVASYAGCRYIVVRPLFAGIPEVDLWRWNKEYYLELAELAGIHNIMILLENQCKDNNGHLIRGVCSDAVRVAEWIDMLNQEAGKECFGFCMDIGVCSLCGQNIYDFILALGNRLKAVILHDCDGSHENALLPFTCVDQAQPQTDWLNLLRGLREICFDGQLILNIKDTASVFSPILHPKLMALTKSVADYFKWQIEMENIFRKYSSLVLFGAGNMCRNYMKCYGEKYPPLYTCDNNKELWGGEFCGLEVKNPECLMELNEDCAVIICNIYYREIEMQLKRMGIKNPIEYFNDEYMPSFYFNRIKRDMDNGGLG